MVALRGALRKYDTLIAWLKWNKAGRKGVFRNSLVKEIELDTTTQCSGLPSCHDECTYIHSRNMGHTLGIDLAEKILGQLYDLSLRRVIFSGGGEPLEPGNVSFLEILELASSKKIETELLTNGKFLTADILPSLLPHLMVLRISVPPLLHGYSHLLAVHDQVKGAVEYRNQEGLEVKIMASLLIRPDTPESEIKDDIEILSNLSLDLIRFKPTHMYDSSGNLNLDVAAYKKIIRFIIGFNHPQVIISKINRLLKTEGTGYPYCYWTDFNPFVIGADGKNYACCEHKYHEEYQRGDFNHQTAEEILEFTGRNTQAILPGCFKGCKGDLANRYLYALVNGYELFGDEVFGQEKYQEFANMTLASLIRSHPHN